LVEPTGWDPSLKKRGKFKINYKKESLKKNGKRNLVIVMVITFDTFVFNLLPENTFHINFT